ncbi:hypothetical protein TNCV_2920751 [Trichonephila clavipes]|nr:hypothetical protein TNCV_2920751 [Trichonephila clavipes]
MDTLGMHEAGQSQAEMHDGYKRHRKWSFNYGRNSKQVVLSPERSTKTTTKQRHQQRITTWHYAHEDICEQPIHNFLMSFLQCLEEEFPGKQSIDVLKSLAFASGVLSCVSL